MHISMGKDDFRYQGFELKELQQTQFVCRTRTLQKCKDVSTFATWELLHLHCCVFTFHRLPAAANGPGWSSAHRLLESDKQHTGMSVLVVHM